MNELFPGYFHTYRIWPAILYVDPAKRWTITTNMGQGHPNGNRQSNIQRAAWNLCVGEFWLGTRFCANPRFAPKRCEYTLILWPKAPTCILTEGRWSYAGPTCTRCPGAEGPADAKGCRNIGFFENTNSFELWVNELGTSFFFIYGFLPPKIICF